MDQPTGEELGDKAACGPGADAPGDFDAIVLGAGISGLVATSVLLSQGQRRILVIDEYDHVGGNHIDRSIGGYTFDVGSLIFQDDSPLLRHFPELLAHYLPIDPSWGRLTPQGRVTHYPLSLKVDFVEAGPIQWCRIVASVLWSRLGQRRPANARDFARYWIGGHFLRRSGLERYMERFYGLPPEQIDISFAEKRMGWIKHQSQLRTHVRRLLAPATATVTNTQLARPREGFAHLYRPAVERLQARGVSFRLGARLSGLGKRGRDFVLQTDRNGAFAARRVVSTLPLPLIGRLCGLAFEPKLRTVTLISLFFSFTGARGFAQSILYNFSSGGAWKRLTVYSDFYGPSAGREFFTVELNAADPTTSVAAAEQDFRRHVAENRLFQGDLRLEGSHVLENAYPVYTENAEAKAAAAVAALRAIGVESIGRQGRFDYQPTARASTIEAEAALGGSSPLG